MKNARTALYVRNIIFGIEDSLVSTVGLLSGIAVVGVNNAILLTTGLVLIFVEGTSMAIGSFLSEESTQEYEKGEKASAGEAIRGGTVMFFSYVAAGFIPLAPYLLLPNEAALWWSVGLSLATLGLVGYAHARFSKLRILPRVIRIVILGGLAIGIGIAVGQVFGIA